MSVDAENLVREKKRSDIRGCAQHDTGDPSGSRHVRN
jgi:hypothetical protein